MPDVIDDDESLWRRFKPIQVDPHRKKVLPTAFFGGPPIHEISVDRANFTSEEATVARGDGRPFGIFGVVARDARIATGRQPESDKVPGNCAHALIFLDENLASDATVAAELPEAFALAEATFVVRSVDEVAWKEYNKAAKKARKSG